MQKQIVRSFGATLTIVAVLLAHVTSVHAQFSYSKATQGSDISWPNCKASLPQHIAFGIVGVTGGKNFTVNPCLFEETQKIPYNLALYMNTADPGIGVTAQFMKSPQHCLSDDSRCLAYNYGFKAAMYALDAASSRDVHATIWWLDVETVNSWSTDISDNRSALQGMIDAIHKSVILAKVGFYSATDQWAVITGNWTNKLPNWVGTGGTQLQTATAACKANDFTGGGTVLTQYIPRLDQDYVCKSTTF